MTGIIKRLRPLALATVLLAGCCCGAIRAEEMPRIGVSADGRGFVSNPGGRPFIPRGFNYDHDADGTLLEDYWLRDWKRVEGDFAEMRQLGANVVRVHLQLGRFFQSADQPNEPAFAQLSALVQLAERVGIYLDITGLGCYHKADVPAWYDGLDEPGRWAVQARFWERIVAQVGRSPAIFCYDLMNEPVVPGAPRAKGDWLGPPFAGKHFVQFITLDPQKRARPAVAKLWIEHLVSAVRRAEAALVTPKGESTAKTPAYRHLVTVGLVDWSLDRPGLTSGFVPNLCTESLDFISVHIYPESRKLDAAKDTLRGFAIGKPVVVEETFPLRCSSAELAQFMEDNAEHARGWISFYWGRTPEELATSRKIGDILLRDWLKTFPVKRTDP